MKRPIPVVSQTVPGWDDSKTGIDRDLNRPDMDMYIDMLWSDEADIFCLYALCVWWNMWYIGELTKLYVYVVKFNVFQDVSRKGAA